MKRTWRPHFWPCIAVMLLAVDLPADRAIAQTASGAASSATDTSKARARRKDFDETVQVACAQETGESFGTCQAGVSRSGPYATVAVTFSNGFTRSLFFTDGAFVRGNSTMSGVGTDTDWQLNDGAYVIRVDDQRFEVPRAFVGAMPLSNLE